MLGPLGDWSHSAQSGLPREGDLRQDGDGSEAEGHATLAGPGKFANQQVSGLERPREEWIEIPVPALVSAEQFEQVREQLQANKRHATRRTKEPPLLLGMLACRRCGYAYYRCSTRTTKRKLYFDRCPGSDGWRWEDGLGCPSRPVRQDRLDSLAWRQPAARLPMQHRRQGVAVRYAGRPDRYSRHLPGLS